MADNAKWLVAGALALLVGCQQSAVGPANGSSSSGSDSFGATSSSSGTGSGPSSTASSTATSSSGASTAASTSSASATTASASSTGNPATASSSSSSGTTGASCLETGPNSPTLTCVRSSSVTSDIVASRAVEVDCTLGSGESPVSFDVVSSPAYTYNDTRSALSTHQVWVTVVPTMLPSIFPDTTIETTITAHFCTAAPSTSSVSWQVLGNTLVADKDTSIRSFASDGTEVAPFLGPTQVPEPSLIGRLGNGNFLAGCAQSSACTHSLQVFSPAGTLVSTFDDTDHSGNALWPSGVRPWGMAQDTSGNVWVSGYQGEDQAGVLLVFTSTGGYSATPGHPADPNQALGWWVPLGIAPLSDGSMVVAMGGAEGDEPYLVRYPNRDPTSPTLIHLGWETCMATGGTPSCDTTDFANGDASDLLNVGGNLLVTTTYSTPAQILSYGDPGLALNGASVISNTNVDDWGNDFLGQITPFGSGYLTTGNFSDDCVYLVSGSTLYPPTSLDSAGGCFLTNGAVGSIQGLWHLTSQ